MNDDFWNGKSENSRESSKNNDDDFWNGKPESTEASTKNNDDDFWNGKEKVAETNNVDDFWIGKSSKEEKGGELEVNENWNLVYKKSKKNVFSQNRFMNFEKVGGFFKAYSTINTRNNYKIDNIKRHNVKYLFDGTGNILVSNARMISVDEYKMEIQVTYRESIIYKGRSEKNSFGNYFVYYTVKSKHEVYDLKMNLKKAEYTTKEIDEGNL